MAGAPARWVAVPGTVDAVGAVLDVAADEELAVVPRGAGTKIDWGAAPSRVDIVLDTGRLAGIGHWSPGEQTVEVGAGTPLRSVQAVLAQGRHRLAMDAPSTDATIGGVLSADETGPLHHRYGTPGQQVVGMSYVDSAGVPSQAGNRAAAGDPVGGHDLTRLLCGSQGALGVLVSATLRVQPLPASRIWVSGPVRNPSQVQELVGELVATTLAPSAVELDLPAVDVGRLAPRRQRPNPPIGSLVVLLEGDPTDVAERAAWLVDLFDDDAEVTDAPPDWWSRYPFGPEDVALRIDAPAGDLHAALYALRDVVGAPVPVRGAAGLGLVHAALPGSMSPGRVTSVLDAVRRVLLARAGSCVVVSAPPQVRDAVDLWGDLPGLPALRQVKERFDPYRRLAPGRLPGGI
ncbi:FAD-linked oxidase C-terminal domain-containing protein [Micromonospora sonneratiae]